MSENVTRKHQVRDSIIVLGWAAVLASAALFLAKRETVAPGSAMFAGILCFLAVFVALSGLMNAWSCPGAGTTVTPGTSQATCSHCGKVVDVFAARVSAHVLSVQPASVQS